MIIYIGADHRGFRLKNILQPLLEKKGYTVIDVSGDVYNANDDYPDIAASVAHAVAENPGQRRGILICGSGVGMDIVANKFPGVRAALALSLLQVRSARRDDDANILTIAADFTSVRTAQQMVLKFLTQSFSKVPRYARRIKKIARIERSFML